MFGPSIGDRRDWNQNPYKLIVTREVQKWLSNAYTSRRYPGGIQG